MSNLFAVSKMDKLLDNVSLKLYKYNRSGYY